MKGFFLYRERDKKEKRMARIFIVGLILWILDVDFQLEHMQSQMVNK